MSPMGFELTISVGEQLQTHALDRVAIGTGYGIILIKYTVILTLRLRRKNSKD